MKRASWLLLVLPCFLLIGFGYVWRARREQKFELVMDKVFLAPLAAQDRQKGFDTKVVVVMTAQGTWPEWMTSQAAAQGTSQAHSTRVNLFYNRNGRRMKFNWPKGIKSTATRAAHYDEEQQRFVTYFLLNLSAVPPQLGKIVCDVQFSSGPVIYTTRPVWKIATTAKGSLVVRP